MTIKEFRAALAKAGFTEEFFGKGVFTIPITLNVKAVITIRNNCFDLTYRVMQPFSGELRHHYGIDLSTGLSVITAILETVKSSNIGTN